MAISLIYEVNNMKKNRTKFFSVHCTGDVESMRRKIVAFTCLVTCLLLVVSCNKGQQAMENDSHTNAVGDCYYKSELNKDDFPSRVSLYQIDHWHSTDYNIEEALIKGTVVGHEVWAQGPQTIADYNGDQEYLTFYDAGEAFNGKKGNSIDGGFIYVDSSVKKWYEECSIPSPKWDQYNTIAHGASEEIKNDLIQVVENPEGTAKDMKINGVTIAGKTGTAELKASKDEKADTIGWFDCFTVNKDNPYLFIGMVEKANNNGGSHYLIPMIKRAITN